MVDLGAWISTEKTGFGRGSCKGPVALTLYLHREEEEVSSALPKITIMLYTFTREGFK